MERRRINVRAIIWRDGKLLAVRHKRNDGSPSAHWAVPGGGLDLFEPAMDGVVREVREELGVNAKVGKLLFTQQFLSSREDFEEEMEFFYGVEDSSEFDSIDLMKTSHGTEEIYEVAFVDPKAVYILPDFLSEINIAAYIEGELPVYHDIDFPETVTAPKEG